MTSLRVHIFLQEIYLYIRQVHYTYFYQRENVSERVVILIDNDAAGSLDHRFDQGTEIKEDRMRRKNLLRN